MSRESNPFSPCSYPLPPLPHHFRRAFSNLDKVKEVLVLGVCRLITRTYSIISGRHNKKTAAFARACIAYCYITIPMMDGYLDRLSLYALCGQLAVLNQSLHQAEVCEKEKRKMLLLSRSLIFHLLVLSPPTFHFSFSFLSAHPLCSGDVPSVHKPHPGCATSGSQRGTGDRHAGASVGVHQNAHRKPCCCAWSS